MKMVKILTKKKKGRKYFLKLNLHFIFPLSFFFLFRNKISQTKKKGRMDEKTEY